MFRIDAQPGRFASLSLSWFLFAAAIALYFYAAHARQRDNPGDRVIPGFSQLGEGITTAFLNPPDEAEAAPAGASLVSRFLHSMLWTDTLASAKRFGWSMLLLIPAVLLGLHMGMFPVVGQFFLRFILFFDKIVALSVLPILISAILESSSIPNAMNRIGKTERATILSKNRMNRRKNWPTTGNMPM